MEIQQLKDKISFQSKENFRKEKDLRYLDSKIALLISHKISADVSLVMHVHTFVEFVAFACTHTPVLLVTEGSAYCTGSRFTCCFCLFAVCCLLVDEHLFSCCFC